MNLLVYVAGSSQERARVRAAMTAVSLMRGLENAYDWIGNMERVGRPDCELSTSERAMHGLRNLEHVNACDVMWLLFSKEFRSDGRQTEWGYMLHRAHAAPELGLQLIVSGDPGRCLFTPEAPGFATREFETDAEALDYLRILGASHR